MNSKSELRSSSGFREISDLEAKFNDERDELEKKEADERHAFDMMAQDLTDQVAVINSSHYK